MNAKQRRQNRRNVPAKGTRFVFDLESHWPTMDALLKEFKGLAKGQPSMITVRPHRPVVSILRGQSEGIHAPFFDMPLVRRVNVLKERPAGGGFFIDMDFTKLEERIAALNAEVEA